MVASKRDAQDDRRIELRIGSTVMCLDGKAGRLERVIFSPRRRRVSHIVVHRGVLSHKDRVIPIIYVVQTADRVQLNLRLTALGHFPVYDPEAYATPSATWQTSRGYAPDEALLTLGGTRADLHGRPAERSGVLEPVDGADSAKVVVNEGTHVVLHDPALGLNQLVGRVALVLLDRQAHYATHIVVRRGWLSKRDIIVPLDWVSEIASDHIVIDAEPHQLEQVPEYRPDEEIAEDIRQALYLDPAFGDGADFYSIQVVVHDGVAELRGNVRNSTRRHEAEHLARRVSGVIDVENYLVADDELELTVEQALTFDERLQVQHLRVHSVLGVVRIEGEVSTPEQRELAEQIVRHLPGVQAVNNALLVAGSAPAATSPIEDEEPIR